MVASKVTRSVVQRQVVVASEAVKDPLPLSQIVDDPFLATSSFNPSQKYRIQPRANQRVFQTLLFLGSAQQF